MNSVVIIIFISIPVSLIALGFIISKFRKKRTNHEIIEFINSFPHVDSNDSRDKLIEELKRKYDKK